MLELLFIAGGGLMVLAVIFTLECRRKREAIANEPTKHTTQSHLIADNEHETIYLVTIQKQQS